MRSEDMSKRFVLILPHAVTTFPMAPHISIEDTGFQMALPREGLFQGPRTGRALPWVSLTDLSQALFPRAEKVRQCA